MDNGISDIARRHLRRNFFLGVGNGVLFNLSNALTETSLVLTWFVSQLTGSNFLIGLVGPIREGGWFLPQLLVSGYLQRQKRKLPLYKAVALVRTVSWGAMTLSVFLVNDRLLLLLLFYLFLTITSLAAGFAGLSFMDIVGKTIPPRRRGSFFSTRLFFGGVAGLGGSALVSYLLSERSGLDFPTNYAALMAIAFAVMSLAMGSFALVVEPVEAVNGERVPLFRQLQRATELPRRDANFRRFLAMRLCLMVAQVAVPFYIVYAQRTFQVPASMLGVYQTGLTLASVISNLAWGWISDRQGNRRLVRISSLVGMTMPVAALVMAPLSRLAPSLSGMIPYLFAVIFVAMGSYRAASVIGNINYLLEIAPAEERTLYVGFTNTLLGVATFTSSVGGLIVDLAGFATLFWLALIFYGLAFLLSCRLREPRVA
ncbi:MAG: MFS transporter [Chloroflexota bacterium]|nr:MFS transporter [Chloroflexota bacterium]